MLLVDGAAFGTVMRFPGERDCDLRVGVLPERRHEGIGSALFERLAAHAAAHGWTSVLSSASDEEGVEWLARRGFVEVDRQERVVLELAEVPVRDAAPLPGIVVSDLAERPELLRSVYDLLVEGLRDVPGDLAEDVPDFDTFLRWFEAPSRLPEFVVLALEDERPVGMAGLNVYPRVGYHGFTTVARDARGRGIARVLKLELIRRARARGLERLLTQSNVDNVPMRTLNAELGYRPAPASVFMRRHTV